MLCRSGSKPGGETPDSFLSGFCYVFFLPHTFLSPQQRNLCHSREMSEQPGVRALLQPERLHPGNHLKNLKNRANMFTNALVVIAEEPESAESQEEHEYPDLDLCACLCLCFHFRSLPLIYHSSIHFIATFHS